VLKCDRSDVLDKLTRYFKCGTSRKKYFKGLEYVMPYKEKALKYGNIMWDRECKEILKSDPDYSLVISVIRGHSLVEIFKNDSDSPSSTKE